MSKHDLTDQTPLRYTGKHFEGFERENPFMIFLGYDCSGWPTIWVDYLDVLKFIALCDVEVTETL